MAKLKQGVNKTAATGELSKADMAKGFKKLRTVNPLENGKGKRDKEWTSTARGGK